MNHTYSSLIPTDHSSASCSRETSRLFEAPYTIYPSHSTAYPEYSTSKLEVFDYNHWPTTTHNLLAHPTNVILDQIPNASSSVETFVPTPSVNFSHLNSSTIPMTHHHHHIHQHLYPPLSSSPTCNESTPWLATSDYQSFDSTGNTSSYGHYSNYSANTYYDPPQSQWTSPSTNLPIKFESSHSSSPSCFDLSDGQEPITREDHPSNSISPIKHFKATPPPLPSSSSTTSQLISIPPRNPMNGKTRTRDKYRIVYTEQQRHELENEFVTSKYITIPRKAALSLTLALSERQIKIWFQNRRAKERKLQKKRLENSSNRHLNNSNDGDSPSDGDFESPTYYPNYI